MQNASSSSRLLSSSLEVHLGYWLRCVSNNVSGEFRRALHARQVSVTEWVALSQIEERQQPTPGELARSMALTPGAVSKVLDKLTAKKWITRVTKAGDNRVQLLTLTRQGRQILPQLAEIADCNDDHFFGCLSSDEQATLRKLLRKLAELHRFSEVPMD